MIKKTIDKIVNKFGYIPKKNKNVDYNEVLYESLFSDEILKSKPFYNIGAGKFYHPYWINVDFESEYYNVLYGKEQKYVINHNLLEHKPFPIKDNYAKIMYTSHTIEHIDNKSSVFLFQEVYRCLEPSGLFRITCPDADLLYSSYINNDIEFYYWRKWYSDIETSKKAGLEKTLIDATIDQLFLFQIASSLSVLTPKMKENKINDHDLKEIIRNKEKEDALNYLISLCTLETQKKYPGNHINWWNFDKLENLLKKIGFKEVRRSGYGQSFSPILRNTDLFDNTHPKMSIYVEAVK